MGSFTKKQKIMGGLAGGLVLLVAMVYLRPLLAQLPTRAALVERERELKQLYGRLQRLEQHQRQVAQEQAVLRRHATRFLHGARGRVLTTVLQNDLQNLARLERVTLRSVSAPRAREVSAYIRSVEVSVRIQGDMQEIGRFLARLDASQPKFFWASCTIRPINMREPSVLDLSGRIEALYVVDDAELLIYPEAGRP